MASEAFDMLASKLDHWGADPEKVLFIGQRNLPCPEQGEVTFFCGTDVSGSLHLGHLYNFLCGSILASSWNKELIVSLNEGETILSRKKSLSEAMDARTKIIGTLSKYGMKVHSRLDDSMLNCVAFVIFRELINTKYQELILRYYGMPLDAADLLSVSIMAAVPLSLAIKEKSQHVVAVYGVDELAHLCLMVDLYSDRDFQQSLCGFELEEFPNFGFAVTHLVPGLVGEMKMSKTIPTELVPFDEQLDSRGSQRILDVFHSFNDFVDESDLLLSDQPLMQVVKKFLSSEEASE